MQVTVGIVPVTLQHSGSVVTASASVSDGIDFRKCVSACNMALSAFRATNTNYWGADGIGYMVQEKAGTAVIHKSTVGPVQYKRGLADLQTRNK